MLTTPGALQIHASFATIRKEIPIIHFINLFHKKSTTKFNTVPERETQNNAILIFDIFHSIQIDFISLFICDNLKPPHCELCAIAI